MFLHEILRLDRLRDASLESIDEYGSESEPETPRLEKEVKLSWNKKNYCCRLYHSSADLEAFRCRTYREYTSIQADIRCTGLAIAYGAGVAQCSRGRCSSFDECP